jgi:hypothetical protein
MDATRFDTIAKALISETNRRRTLSGLLGGVVGRLAFADVEAKTSKKTKSGGGQGGHGQGARPRRESASRRAAPASNARKGSAAGRDPARRSVRRARASR